MLVCGCMTKPQAEAGVTRGSEYVIMQMQDVRVTKERPHVRFYHFTPSAEKRLLYQI